MVTDRIDGSIDGGRAQGIESKRRNGMKAGNGGGSGGWLWRIEQMGDDGFRCLRLSHLHSSASPP